MTSSALQSLQSVIGTYSLTHIVVKDTNLNNFLWQWVAVNNIFNGQEQRAARCAAIFVDGCASYCLSNAMHGQNINLPVCVCVCVSVCLSVCVRHTFCQLAYRSDPSTDFYSWQLKRCGFTQGCAFWGSRWWIITFMGPKSPKTPFWGPKNKLNMRKIQIAISSDHIDMKFDRQLRPAIYFVGGLVWW